MSHAEHHAASSGVHAACHVITCSDTRTLETDAGGGMVCDLLEHHGHRVAARDLIPDEPARLLALLPAGPGVHVTIVTGGTGLSTRDTTFDTLTARYDSPIPGFGELFRMASYEEIGAASMLSRASAGRIGSTVVFSLPGSVHAVQMAMERLILPELGHIVRELSR